MIIKLVAARESSDLKFLFPLAYIEKNGNFKHIKLGNTCVHTS